MSADGPLTISRLVGLIAARAFRLAKGGPDYSAEERVEIIRALKPQQDENLSRLPEPYELQVEILRALNTALVDARTKLVRARETRKDALDLTDAVQKPAAELLAWDGGPKLPGWIERVAGEAMAAARNLDLLLLEVAQAADDTALSTAKADRLEEATAPASTTERAESENAILLVGEVWELHYGNERGRFPRRGNKSIEYLQTILRHPNRSLTVADVLGDPERKLEGDAQLYNERQLDDAGIRAIMRRLDEIEAAREERGRSSDLLDEEEAVLLHQLKDASAVIKTPLQKAHHNIATQLRQFMRKKLASMPHLKAHLRDTLKLNCPHLGY
jgi:hypothetical protein